MLRWASWLEMVTSIAQPSTLVAPNRFCRHLIVFETPPFGRLYYLKYVKNIGRTNRPHDCYPARGDGMGKHLHSRVYELLMCFLQVVVEIRYSFLQEFQASLRSFSVQCLISQRFLFMYWWMGAGATVVTADGSSNVWENEQPLHFELPRGPWALVLEKLLLCTILLPVEYFTRASQGHIISLMCGGRQKHISASFVLVYLYV